MSEEHNLYIPLPHRACIRISGTDAASFLQGLITNNINKATVDAAIYALMLTPQGKFLYDFFIVMQKDAYLIDIAALHKEAIIKKLGMYKLRSDVVIDDLSNSFECVALLGENVASEISQHETGNIRNFCKGTAYIDPRNSNLGARAFIERENHYQSFEAKGFTLGEFSAYERNRIEAMVADGDRDMVHSDSFPLDFNCDKIHAIDFNKGCYVGQEVTARVHHKSAPKKTIYRVASKTEPLPKTGSDIHINGRKVGELRSHHATIGLALLRKDDVKNTHDAEINGIKITISSS